MKPFTILVIDDEPQMRNLVRTFLEKDGYAVEEATDGADALSKVYKLQPHLCIVDVMMPYMNGFDFAKELKTDDQYPSYLLICERRRMG